ncbi:hypothetical protein CDUR_03010 [Corynebacterium durum]|nr:hypothetical protein CDUR_03010 [Corynebacterium durum]
MAPRRARALRLTLGPYRAKILILGIIICFVEIRHNEKMTAALRTMRANFLRTTHRMVRAIRTLGTVTAVLDHWSLLGRCSRLVINNKPARVSPRFTHRLRQSCEVIILISVWVNIMHAHKLPAKRSCDFSSVGLTQIPAMRLTRNSKRTNNSGLISVGIGQCGYCRLATSWAGTTTKLTHATKSRPEL